MMSEIRITGVYVNYYEVCRRKLWLFSKNITMEDKSDLVAIGKLIDEHSYSREEKHIAIDNTINIDFIGSQGIIHEVKKSKSIEKADISQVKYYLYYLEKRGIHNLKGVIDYPKMKRKVEVLLADNDIGHIETMLAAIREILGQERPPAVKKTRICKQCAYNELCFI